MRKKKWLDIKSLFVHSKQMAVFTPVSQEQLTEFLGRYDIGSLVSCEGIEAGVSNTNYFVTTQTGRYVLTLFEPHRVRAQDIPSYVEYSTVLEKSGVPCPKTIQTKEGDYIATLCDRPAAFFSVLQGDGGSVAMLDANLCEQAGATLAQMHIAAQKIKTKTPNHFGLGKWQEWERVMGARMNNIDAGLHSLVQSELGFIVQNWPKNLPCGQIHADYFPDNVFFQEGRLTGVIDFHFVCYDVFAYDLAIAINAWSFDEHNHFQEDRMMAMMRGYESVRPLNTGEEKSLPVLLRAASMRFLLSRIEEKLKWKEGDFMKPHDPMVFEKRLKHFQKYSMPA